jgi:hypothetical protein
MIEASITFLLIIGVWSGTQSYTQTFIKSETVDLQADRISNAAFALDTMPEGHIELNIENYKFKVDGDDEFWLKFREREVNRSIDSDFLIADKFEGPSDYEKFETLCLQKKNESSQIKLEFNLGGC